MCVGGVLVPMVITVVLRNIHEAWGWGGGGGGLLWVQQHLAITVASDI